MDCTTADIKGKFVYIYHDWSKKEDLVFAGHEFLREGTPANN